MTEPMSGLCPTLSTKIPAKGLTNVAMKYGSPYDFQIGDSTM